jgi:arylsulfatase A-like enzyme
VLLTALLAVAALPARAQSSSAEQPNIVVIFTDDLGYGDIGPFGHPTIRTPHLDRMASKGMKLTQFYVADPVCTPSRAALMTGRLPVRSGLTRVLYPDDSTGLPAREVTLAEALSDQGYATAAVGKWHLGHLPQYLPTAHGFDSYFGVPYSNDMYADPDAAWERKRHFPDVPLMRDTTVVERPVRQATLTRRYTEEATQFIRENRGEQPFFLYLAHTFPHVPLHASERFRGESRRGRYGDVVEELDWSVGRVLQTLRERDLAENTLVVFTSDNGPWLTKGLRGGSPGLLRNGKGTTWEGGMRVPTIAWWPSEIEGGTVSAALGTTMDLYTTALRLAGATPPARSPCRRDGPDARPARRVRQCARGGAVLPGRPALRRAARAVEGALQDDLRLQWRDHRARPVAAVPPGARPRGAARRGRRAPGRGRGIAPRRRAPPRLGGFGTAPVSPAHECRRLPLPKDAPP